MQQFFNTLQPLRGLPPMSGTATHAHLISVLSSLATQRRVTPETPVTDQPAVRSTPTSDNKPTRDADQTPSPAPDPAPPSKVSLELTAPALGADELRRMAEGCFMRLIRSSTDATHVTRRAAPKTRSSLLSFLASQREV